MKYDDSEYYFLNFETDTLTNLAATTHIGMYVAWNIIHDLISDEYHNEEIIEDVKTRKTTGSSFVITLLDGKLHDEDLNEEGNNFATWYYESYYFDDYSQVFAIDGENADAFCSVEDTWENFDRLAPVLDHRFNEWRVTAHTPDGEIESRGLVN